MRWRWNTVHAIFFQIGFLPYGGRIVTVSFNGSEKWVRKKIDAIDVQDSSRGGDVGYGEVGIHRGYGFVSCDTAGGLGWSTAVWQDGGTRAMY